MRTLAGTPGVHAVHADLKPQHVSQRLTSKTRQAGKPDLLFGVRKPALSLVQGFEFPHYRILPQLGQRRSPLNLDGPVGRASKRKESNGCIASGFCCLLCVEGQLIGKDVIV
jgi:hypothetical protein